MSQFLPLPFPEAADGSARRCGVEIEFSGLTEKEVAKIVQSQLGGTISRKGRHEMIVGATRLGDIRIELDAQIAKTPQPALIETGLDLAKTLIPTEIVTEPLCPTQLPELVEMCRALRTAGGEGTTYGPLNGFGVHLNMAVTAPDAAFTRRTIVAFGLLEPWLRRTLPPDNTRRVMPFVNPWPQSLVDALVAHPDASLATQRQLYATHVKSRNHGLDLLPLFKSADPIGYLRDFPAQTEIAARPAFHFRLPDCRIDDPDWSLDEGWSMWRAVETLAATPDLLAALSAAWLRHRAQVFHSRRQWTSTVADLLIPQMQEPVA